MRTLAILLLLALPSCQAVGDFLEKPAGGPPAPVLPGDPVPEIKTIGEVIEDSGAAQAVGSLVGTFTGNPLLGSASAATLLALLAAARRRRTEDASA